MKNLFDVSGKIAVVTGGSSGIGAMMARGLLENGAKVYITARKEERLIAMAEELSQYGEVHSRLPPTCPIWKALNPLSLR